MYVFFVVCKKNYLYVFVLKIIDGFFWNFIFFIMLYGLWLKIKIKKLVIGY